MCEYQEQRKSGFQRRSLYSLVYSAENGVASGGSQEAQAEVFRLFPFCTGRRIQATCFRERALLPRHRHARQGATLPQGTPVVGRLRVVLPCVSHSFPLSALTLIHTVDTKLRNMSFTSSSQLARGRCLKSRHKTRSFAIILTVAPQQLHHRLNSSTSGCDDFSP